VQSATWILIVGGEQVELPSSLEVGDDARSNVSCSSDSVRDEMATLAPSSLKRRAIALPIPRPAPVTRTRFPMSDNEPVDGINKTKMKMQTTCSFVNAGFASG
jgi:hypothetical protein